jgi:hypothetical protein
VCVCVYGGGDEKEKKMHSSSRLQLLFVSLFFSYVDKVVLSTERWKGRGFLIPLSPPSLFYIVCHFR